MLLRRASEMCVSIHTDYHDVDEDVRTITSYGVSWASEKWTGIARRDLSDPPTTIWNSVASKK